MQQLNTVDHHYLSANLKFQSDDALSWPKPCIVIAVNDDEPRKTALVFPNPASDQVRVRFSSAKGDGMLRVINIAGQVVIAREIDIIGGDSETVVPVDRLSPGVYVVQLLLQEGIQTARLVIE